MLNGNIDNTIEILKDIVCGLGALYLLYHFGSFVVLLTKEFLRISFKQCDVNSSSERNNETLPVYHTGE